MISVLVQFIFLICLLLIIYSYAIYPTILWMLNRVKQPPKVSFDPNYEPSITIIIAAFNEVSVIGERIENCLKLDYPMEKLQIIIASDGSDDGTNDVIKKYDHPSLTPELFQQRRGKVNVLNDCIDRAKNEICVFSDANTDFKPDALKKLVRHFQQQEVGCVCGALHFINPEGHEVGHLEGFYWKYESFMKKVEGKWGCLLGANGGIFAIRKELFFKCPPDTIVEDFVVPMKVLEKNFKVLYDVEAIATEKASKKIVQEKQRRIRIGAGDFQALTRLTSMLDLSRGFAALAFWSHKVLRWLAPFFLIIVFITNLFLLDYAFYRGLFFAQCLFYLAAIIGQFLSWAGVSNRLFNLCYYFVSMNLALLLGFFRFLGQNQSVKWNRTERD